MKKGRTMTDHAIVRYLERFMGINIRELEEAIRKDNRARKVTEGRKVVTVCKYKGV